MAFSPHILDDIKNRVSVSSVVGRRVKLQRRGREYVGLSPFKAEKTPSFTVNDDKQFYHCFATGKHGSIFDFLIETEGVSFPEAVERLASEAGVSLPAHDPQAAQKAERRRGLSDWMALAGQWFEQQLRTRQGTEASDYLRRRTVQDELCQRFGVGYAPKERTGLRNFLTQKGATEQDLLAAGLIIKPDDGGPAYDRFRDRIMFPIHDARGRVIAFGGRALDPNAPAKYLNSPETELFHKGDNLYNFHRARQSAFDTNQLLVVEGYMDVIGLARVGLTAAVAPLGTAITEQQIALLWRLTAEPILCLDGDEAGLRAAYRAIDRCLPILKPGFSLRFALLPRGKDPDDLARDEGLDGVQHVIEKAMSLVDLLWEREKERVALDTPERLADFKQRLRQLISQIRDRDVRELYGQDIKRRLDALFEPSKPRGQTYDRRQAPRAKARMETKRSTTASAASGLSARPMLLLAGVLAHPKLLERHYDSFERLDMPEGHLAAVHAAILDAASMHDGLDRSALKGHLNKLAMDRDLAQIEAMAKAHGLAFTHPEAEFDTAEAAWLEVAELHYKLVTLEREKSEAMNDLAADGQADKFDRLVAITQQQLSDL
jgi:DNA primase